MSAWIGDYMDDIPDADNMADMDNMASIDNMDAMNKKNEKVLQNIKMTEKYNILFMEKKKRREERECAE